jgi:RimJ/RimL family protein N-acetyltransferase
MKDILIETERFLLKSLTKEDVNKRYLDWINDPNKSQYITYGNKQRDINELCSYVDERLLNESILFLGIFIRESGIHIGNVKYEPIDFQNGFTVMGILIGEENWKGKGVAKEVIRESSMWLNSKHGIQQIILGVDVRNINAIKAYQKCGFILEKTPYIENDAENHTTMVWNLTKT